MQKWVSEDVIVTITNTLGAVTHKVSSASDAIMEEVANLREMFSKRVVQNTFDMLSGIEDRLWESEATMKAFWDRAMSYTSRFTEVWFVQGANAMIAEISQISLRAKSKIFIVAPRLEDIDFVPLKPLPDKIAIRICCAIDPENPKNLEIIKQYINKQNYRFRHYTGENIWGVSRDFEEIILGAVANEDVAGIGSVIDEHIKNLNPVLEEAWMKGKDVASFDQVKSLVITPEIKAKPVEVPVPAAAAAPMKAGKNAPKPLKGKVTAPELVVNVKKPSAQAAPLNAITKLRKEMVQDITEKFASVKESAGEMNQEILSKALEELKEYVVNKYGFSRLVFELSKRARTLAKTPTEIMTQEQVVQLSNDFDEWMKAISS